MRRVNNKRNSLLYPFWDKGDTIDEASMVTGIPRSTVGYYWKKFNRYRKAGKVSDLKGFEEELSEGQKDQLNIFNYFIKKGFLENIMELFNQAYKSQDCMTKYCNWGTLYFNLASTKLLIELLKYTKITPEEAKSLEKEINASIAHASTPTPQSASTTTTDNSVVGILKRWRPSKEEIQKYARKP